MELRKRNISKFTYGISEIDIVSKFAYLCVVFTTGGSFSETQEALSRQALNAVYKLKSYIYHFHELSVSHMLDIFDKLIFPVLNYGAAVEFFY